MAVYSNTSNYWIQKGALHFELNALGDPNKVSVSVAAGAVIMAWKEGVIDYNASHNYRTWVLNAAPTLLSRNDAVYVYARLSKVNDTAWIIYPYEEIEIAPSSSSSSSSSSDSGSSSDDGDEGLYYYIKLGKLTASVVGGESVNREWEDTLNFGTLDTDQERREQSESEWRRMFNLSSNDVIEVLKDMSFLAGNRLLMLRMRALSGGNAELQHVVTSGSFPAGTTSFTGSDGHLMTSAAVVAYEQMRETLLRDVFLIKNDATLTQQVLGPVSFRQGVGVEGNLNVSLDAEIVGGLHVSGIAEFDDEVDVTGLLDCAQSVAVGADLSVGGTVSVDEKVNVGTVQTSPLLPGTTQGVLINSNGTVLAKSLELSESLTVPELRFNRATTIVGANFFTQGGGIIEKVLPLSATTGYVWLKLEEGEAGAVMVGDLCVGVWHNTGTDATYNANSDNDDHNGHITYKGFCTIYFQITQIPLTDPDDVSNADSHCFRYKIRESEENTYTSNGVHPKEGMHFAGYTNISKNNNDQYTHPERQSFSIQTKDYLVSVREVRYWWYDANNIYYVRGVLEGFDYIMGTNPDTGHPYASGEYFAPNETGLILGNIYFYGTIRGFERNIREIAIEQSKGGWLMTNETETVTVRLVDGNGTEVSGAEITSWELYRGSTKIADLVKDNGHATFTSETVSATTTYTVVCTRSDTQVMRALFIERPSPLRGDNAVMYKLVATPDTLNKDGDGVFHWMNSSGQSQSGTTASVYFTAYKIDGAAQSVVTSSDIKWRVKGGSTNNALSEPLTWTSSMRQVIVELVDTTTSPVTLLAETTISALNDGEDATFSLYQLYSTADTIPLDKNKAANINSFMVRLTHVTETGSEPINLSDLPEGFSIRYMINEVANNMNASFVLAENTDGTVDIKESYYDEDEEAVLYVESGQTVTNKIVYLNNGEPYVNTANLVSVPADNANYMVFYLWQYIDNAWVQTDVLTVDLPKDGTDALVIDLSNEMDAVPMTHDGAVSEATTVQTNVQLFSGSTPQTITSLQAVASVPALNVTVTPSYSGTTGSVSVQFGQGAALIHDVFTVNITAGCSRGTRTAEFTIQGVRAGADGQNAIIYQLLPSVTQIVKKKDGTISPSEDVTCVVQKKDGTSVTNVRDISAEGLTLKSQIDNGSESTTTTINPSNVSTKLTYILRKSSTIIDRETIPVVEDGTDGTSVAQLDLNNEADILLYNADGTQRLSASVETTWKLLKGGQDVSGDATVQAIDTGNYTAAWKSGTNNRTLVVSAMTGATANIPIRVLYQSQTYEAVFTVKKMIGTEKYEILCTPNALTYNTSDQTGSSRSVSVQVVHTDVQAHTRNVVSSLSGLSLYVYPETATPSSTYKVNSAYTSGAYTFPVDTQYSGYRVLLTAGDYGTSGSISWDTETIPITKSANGSNGASAVSVNLTNDMDAVAMDSDGKVLTQRDISTKICVYQGSTPLSLTAVPSYSDLPSGVTLNGRNIDGSISFHVAANSQFTGDNVAITISATTSNGTFASVLTIQGVRAGEDAKFDIYQLAPSIDAIKIDGEGSYNKAGFVCNIIDYNENGTTNINRTSASWPADIAVRYTINTIDTDFADETAYVDSEGIHEDGTIVKTDSGGNRGVFFASAIRALPQSGGGTNVYLYLWQKVGNTWYLRDQETIPFIEDGHTGLTADLTNEMDAIAMSSEGTALVANSCTTNISLFYGTEKQTLTSNPSCQFVTQNVSQNITVTSSRANDNKDGVVTVSIPINETLPNNTAVLRISATSSKGTRTADFTIIGVNAGENGGLYRLVPSVNQITKHAETTTPSTGNVTCSVKLSDGHAQSTVTTGFTLKYRLNEGNEGDYAQDYPQGIPVSSITSSVQFILYVGGVVVDKETVPVIKDGLTANPNVLSGGHEQRAIQVGSDPSYTDGGSTAYAGWQHMQLDFTTGTTYTFSAELAWNQVKAISGRTARARLQVMNNNQGVLALYKEITNSQTATSGSERITKTVSASDFSSVISADGQYYCRFELVDASDGVIFYSNVKAETGTNATLYVECPENNRNINPNIQNYTKNYKNKDNEAMWVFHQQHSGILTLAGEVMRIDNVGYGSVADVQSSVKCLENIVLPANEYAVLSFEMKYEGTAPVTVNVSCYDGSTNTPSWTLYPDTASSLNNKNKAAKQQITKEWKTFYLFINKESSDRTRQLFFKHNGASASGASTSTICIEHIKLETGMFPSSWVVSEDDKMGKAGLPGKDAVPAVFCGEYAANTPYYYDNVRRDIVVYNGSYYAVATQGTTVINSTPSSQNTNWAAFQGEFKNIATDVLLSEQVLAGSGHFDGLVVNNLTATNSDFQDVIIRGVLSKMVTTLPNSEFFTAGGDIQIIEQRKYTGMANDTFGVQTSRMVHYLNVWRCGDVVEVEPASGKIVYLMLPAAWYGDNNNENYCYMCPGRGGTQEDFSFYAPTGQTQHGFRMDANSDVLTRSFDDTERPFTFDDMRRLVGRKMIFRNIGQGVVYVCAPRYKFIGDERVTEWPPVQPTIFRLDPGQMNQAECVYDLVSDASVGFLRECYHWEFEGVKVKMLNT